jgi:hypothetical protein
LEAQKEVPAFTDGMHQYLSVKTWTASALYPVMFTRHGALPFVSLGAIVVMFSAPTLSVQLRFVAARE